MKRILLVLFLLPFVGFGQVISAGTYKVGTGEPAPYTTLVSAIARVNSSGISGPVTFLLKNGETLSSTLIINSSTITSTNTLTIKPDAGQNVTISGSIGNSSTAAIIKIEGSDYVTIDGSNNGTSTRNLTLSNTSTSNYANHGEVHSAILWIANKTNSDRASNNTIKNINFIGSNVDYSSSTTAGIVLSGVTNMQTAESISNSDTKILNNSFTRMKFGIWTLGGSSLNQYLTIENNTFGSSTDSNNAIVYNAIKLSNAANAIVRSNNILSVTYSSNGTSTTSGIYLYGISSNTNISSNKISSITSNGRSSGIFVDISTASNSGLIISNNFIRDIKTNDTNTNGLNNSSAGIFLNDGKDISIYYNTVNLSSTQSGVSSALSIANGSLLNIKNNIFLNSNSGGARYAVYSVVGNSAFTINYNNYNAANIGYLGSPRTTLATWKTATAQDANSDDKIPTFVSATDLHLQNVVGNSFLKTGTPIPGITTDIDIVDTRSATTPYMGADEIACIAPATPGTITQPATKCVGSTGNTYSIAAVSGATSYTWSVTGTGWSVTAGGTTTSATITIGSGVGTVSVTATNTCGTSLASTTGNITPDANLPASVSIAASLSGTICSGTSLTFTATATNPGTTPVYQWKVNGANAGSNSSTFTTTTLANSDVVTVVMTSNASPCLTANPATSNSLTMTVNTRPTPTFTTTALAQTCGNVHMTYTTQSGFSNYVWNVSGVLNTDYRRIARGTTTNHDIVIEWLTAGPKTVTVNYTNSNGCNGLTAATYNTDVTVLDKGRLIGGTHICKGSPLPALTLRNFAGNSDYPDASLILKWQYSDQLNNTNWQDIPGTAGQTSYIPSAFPGAFRTYQVILKSGNCTETSIETRINIDAFNAPTLGTITNLSCTVSTGSVALNNLPSGHWTINQTGTATTTYPNTVANTTSYTITGLAAGTYTFTVKEGNCTSGPSLPVKILAGNTWDGSKWSKTGNATLPTAGDVIVFEGDYILTTDLTACSCIVNSGDVKVNTGITLAITNAVTVNGGTLTFENNASLMQDVNTTVNSNFGPIIYKRDSQPMKNFDYTYWSSPVAGQTFYDLSPNTLSDKYMSYTGSGWKLELPSNTMLPGIGYIIRVPKPNIHFTNGEFWDTSTYVQKVEFTGKPNNGKITSSQYMEKGKYYLIGNPYPSAIHADEFLYENANNEAILGGTVYFWTHNTILQKYNSKLAYVSDDYASYNLTGGVSSAPSDPQHDEAGVDNGKKPTGFIAAGQSFFTRAEKGSGYVEFTNSMRHGGSNNSQFFKPGKTSKSGEMEKHRLWLNLTNTGGAFKQTLIGYIEGATNAYDKVFDGLTYDGNSYIDFYSIDATNRLTIQGRALPFTDTDVVPLGYRSTIAGDFTISIDQADGNLASQRIYLEDKQTGTINELTAANYTFTTKAGTFKERFVLRYTNKTLGTGDFETTEDAVSVIIQNKTITVNSTEQNIDKVFIYDVSGKQLYKKDDVNNLELIIQNLPFAQQVLLVKVVLDNGYQTTKKVIFK